MSIHFISGKPGGGKSYLTLRMVVHELRTTTRDICTNLPLVLPELAQYMHDNYGETFNMRERIRMLEQEEVAEFWLHPKQGIKLTEKTKVKIRDNVVEQVDYSKRPPTGTVFIIDEVHLYFNARGWQSTGEDALFYLSQHRKLGDDVILVTQHIGNVDKQFRSVAQDFTYMRNFAKETFGIFRTIPYLQRLTFPQPATGAPGEKAQESALMKLDITGLCKCYKTDAGVGIVSRAGGDVNEKRRGLPLWIFGLGALVVVLAACYLPNMLIKSAFGAAKGPPDSRTNSVTTRNSTNLPPQPAQNIRVDTPEKEFRIEPDKGARAAAGLSNAELPKITGTYRLGGVWRMTLSDGRTLVQGVDTEWEALDKRGALVNGQRLEWAKPTQAAAGKIFESRPLSHNGTVIHGPQPPSRKAQVTWR